MPGGSRGYGVAGLRGYWAERGEDTPQPRNPDPATQQPRNPATPQPSNPATQQPSQPRNLATPSNPATPQPRNQNKAAVPLGQLRSTGKPAPIDRTESGDKYSFSSQRSPAAIFRMVEQALRSKCCLCMIPATPDWINCTASCPLMPAVTTRIWPSKPCGWPPRRTPARGLLRGPHRAAPW